MGDRLGILSAVSLVLRVVLLKLIIAEQSFNPSRVRYIPLQGNTIGKDTNPLLPYPQLWLNK